MVGDHGEGLGQHEQWHHGLVWDEQLHVPLIMRIPGEPAARIAEPAQDMERIRVIVTNFERFAVFMLSILFIQMRVFEQGDITFHTWKCMRPGAFRPP